MAEKMPRTMVTVVFENILDDSFLLRRLKQGEKKLVLLMMVIKVLKAEETGCLLYTTITKRTGTYSVL